jgi:hypothetical protein
VDDDPLTGAGAGVAAGDDGDEPLPERTPHERSDVVAGGEACDDGPIRRPSGRGGERRTSLAHGFFVSAACVSRAR